MLQEKGVTVHVGSVMGTLTGAEMRKAENQALRTSRNPAAVFVGFDKEGNPKPTVAPPTKAGDAAAVQKPSAASGAMEVEDEEIAGVVFEDEQLQRHVVKARVTVIADGMYSVNRKNLHLNQPKVLSHFCGYILKHPAHQPPLPYPNRGHVIMADPNPVLLYQISDTETRILVDVPHPMPSEEDGTLQNYFKNVIAPQLPDCARPAFLQAIATQKPNSCANRGLVSAPVQKKGAVLLGDALNMRHPLTGGGMTVALKDTEMLSIVLKGLDLRSCSSEDLQEAINRFQTARSSHSSTINILANALYRVFSKPASDDGTRDRLRAACVDYLSLGGSNTAGPIGLLSGLTPKPEILITHFFAVAGHAMKRALLPVPTPGRLRQGYDLLHIACIIIMPLIAQEKVTVLSSAPVLGLVNLLFPWKDMQDKLTGGK